MELANNRIGSATQKIKDGAAELGASVLDRGSDIKDAVLDKGRAVLDRGSDLKDAAIQKGRDVYDAGSQKVKQYHSQGANAIRENPYSSVLYAFGVGALVGGLAFLLISSKAQDDRDCDE